MSVFRSAAAMGAAQTYYKVTGLLLLGVLSRSLPPASLGLLLWAQALCESFVLIANLNLNPNLMRRVAAAPEAAAEETAPLLGLRLVGTGAYLLLLTGIALGSEPQVRPFLLGLAVATVLEDLYFLFGTLFIALGRLRYNLAVGVTIQTLYVATVWFGLPREGALTAFVVLSILRGVLLLICAFALTRRCLPGLRPGWSHTLWREQIPLLGTALLTTLRGRAETITATVLLGMATAAPIGLTQRIVVAITFLPLSALSGIAPTLAREGRTPTSLRLVRQAASGLALIGGVMGAALALFPGPIGRLLFGPDIRTEEVLFLCAPLLPLACLEGLAIGVLQVWHREREVLLVGVMGLAAYGLLAIAFVPAHGPAGLLYAQITAAFLRTVLLGVKMLRA